MLAILCPISSQRHIQDCKENGTLAIPQQKSKHCSSQGQGAGFRFQANGQVSFVSISYAFTMPAWTMFPGLGKHRDEVPEATTEAGVFVGS